EGVKIYTRTGDEGETGLFGAGRVPKNHVRVDAYGQVDELNATIGFALALEPQTFCRELLETTQRDLFTIGAELATPDAEKLAKALRDRGPPFRSVVRPGTSGEPRRWLRGNAVVTIPVTLAAPGEVGGKRGGTTSYEIRLGRGLLAELPRLVKSACPATRYAVITDSHVVKLYGEQLVARCHDADVPVEMFQFPAGEWNKTRDTWATLCDAMLAARLGRDSAVIALGGGVVGDLAGFVAATYLRGIPYVQVPTTLLAMIDSSIGGKTGVDVPAGKNLLG